MENEFPRAGGSYSRGSDGKLRRHRPPTRPPEVGEQAKRRAAAEAARESQRSGPDRPASDEQHGDNR